MTDHATNDPNMPPTFVNLGGRMLGPEPLSLRQLYDFAVGIIPASVGNLTGDAETGTELAPMMAWSSPVNGSGYAFAMVAGAREPAIYECAVGLAFEKAVQVQQVTLAVCMGMVWLGDPEDAEAPEREGMILRTFGQDDACDLEATTWYCEVSRTSLGSLSGAWMPDDAIEPPHWTEHIARSIIVPD